MASLLEVCCPRHTLISDFICPLLEDTGGSQDIFKAN